MKYFKKVFLWLKSRFWTRYAMADGLFFLGFAILFSNLPFWQWVTGSIFVAISLDLRFVAKPNDNFSDSEVKPEPCQCDPEK